MGLAGCFVALLAFYGLRLGLGVGEIAFRGCRELLLWVIGAFLGFARCRLGGLNQCFPISSLKGKWGFVYARLGSLRSSVGVG